MLMGIFLGKLLGNNGQQGRHNQGAQHRRAFHQDDRRPARDKANFIVYYEMDDEEVKTVLRAAEHGGDEEGAWVLIEPVEPAEPMEPVAPVEPVALV